MPEIALVGRSNVGKSSLINALVRQTIARTSATPGKTRLANIYRAGRLYLVDLPGVGFARGDTGDFEAITTTALNRASGALLLVDARHPGLANDVSAWTWLSDTVATAALVATKIDKLSRADRQRAMRKIEAVFQTPATAVSAETGEGLEDLWKLIDRIANNR